jgi:tetratricopeptide (TPR) repeat protein
VKASPETKLRKAKSLIKKGNWQAAKQLLEEVLRAFPENKKAQEQMHALSKTSAPEGKRKLTPEVINRLTHLLNQGHTRELIRQSLELTEEFPDDYTTWHFLAVGYKSIGQIMEAHTAFEKVTELNKQFAPGFNNLGVILRELGRHDEAIACYDKALAIKPDYAEAAFNKGNGLKDQGYLNQAIAAFKHAFSLKPDYVDAIYNVANSYKDQAKHEKAVTAYKKTLALSPKHVDAYNNLGNALKQQGKLSAAIDSYKKALSLKPDFVGALNNLGNCLKDQGSVEAAIAEYEKALELDPNHAGTHNNIGTAFYELGKFKEATVSYEKALSLNPDFTDAHNNLGNVLKDQGKLEAALASYTKALSLDPRHAISYRQLGLIINYERDNPHFEKVKALLAEPDLPDDDRCHLLFAYAKMNEDVGKLSTALKNYTIAGKLRKKLLAYDLTQDIYLFEQVKEASHQIAQLGIEFDNQKRGMTPVFVLGMPRSGTTLVEQIISSHSRVFGGGEIPLLDNLGRRLATGDIAISVKNLISIREAYLQELCKISEDHSIVTDKMPHNFLSIGLIMKAFPEAKVIHVKRDPAATCWSNFKQYFSANGLGYSYDLSDTISYFKMYRDLMAFWEKEYPNQIYHLDYDELTMQQEPRIRELIKYVGLDWQDSCLSPHENSRSVKTASQLQIRKKIYGGSSEAWLKFEPYLGDVLKNI